MSERRRVRGDCSTAPPSWCTTISVNGVGNDSRTGHDVCLLLTELAHED